MLRGGADWIEIRNYGHLEVRSTSIPINDDFDTGGIWDIFIDDYSYLLYLGGITEEITIDENAVADLYGGRIDAITSMQYVNGNPHIELFVRNYYYNDITDLLTGTWNVDNDNDQLWDTFSIQLINDSDYDPAIENINFTIVPEPATLLLFTLGSLLIRQKK